MGNNGIFSAYSTGKGSIVIRGKSDIEELTNGKQAIIIIEIPYMVNKAKLVEKIADLVREKKIEGITDLRDESNKDGVRVVIEVKRDVVADIILNQLYSYTQLQTTFGVIMLALDQGMPKIMNLKEVVEAFVQFREEVITKRTIFLLNKARDKSHLLLGIRIAVNNIDEVIKIIKAAASPSEAKLALISKDWQCSDIENLIRLIDDKANINNGTIKLSEEQAKAILEMRLQRLTAMEKEKLEQEINDLAEEIKKYVEILSRRDRLLYLLKSELI